MATISKNTLMKGFSGRLGDVVFKTYRNKTVMARYTVPLSQSEQQKTNRNKFREATGFAKEAMKDEVKKAYFKKKARRLSLPNAYTAAIRGYMRTKQA